MQETHSNPRKSLSNLYSNEIKPAPARPIENMQPIYEKMNYEVGKMNRLYKERSGQADRMEKIYGLRPTVKPDPDDIDNDI